MAAFLRMPQITQTMTAGKIVEWFRHEGDSVRQGDLLVSVETDKAITEVEAPETGVLRRVLVAPGAEAAVNSILAVIAGTDEDIAPILDTLPPGGTKVPSSEAPDRSLAPKPRAARQSVSPRARRLARELNVDLSLVHGTGQDGLITETDVRAHASATSDRGSTNADNEDSQVIPLIGLRGRIAERLALSRRSAADVTTVVDVDMTEVSRLRESMGISATAFVVSAAARSLREFPMLNAWLVDDKIHVKRETHIGIAVALDEGLVVPVLRTADRKSLRDLSHEIDELADRARRGLLSAEEMAGSTLTVSNSGVFGSLLFTPIINPPEVAILGMGKIVDTPVVRDGEIVARKVMLLCLSYDHRAVDGAPAVRFLQAVKRLLEQPAALDAPKQP